MPNNREKGRTFESKAAQFLKDQGYLIKETNWASMTGEIDIIGYDGQTLVFIEVKYRKESTFGWPQEAVTPKKQKKIIKTALMYLKRQGIKNRDIRFDVVSICGSNVEIIKNAFMSDTYYW